MPRPGLAYFLTAALLSAACAPSNRPPAETPLDPEAVTLDTRQIAAGYSVELRPAVPPKRDGPPFMNGEPAHLRVAFDRDSLGVDEDHLQRKLLILPVAEYHRLLGEPERKAFDAIIASLEERVAKHDASPVRQIDILPPAEATQVLRAQVRYLAFHNGAGLRLVTRYAQEVSPTTNDDLFYTFQGLTEDGRYYVSFTCPIDASGLEVTGDVAATTRFLDNLAPRGFQPDLEALDRMIASLELTRDMAR
jgi:hypothetical protein